MADNPLSIEFGRVGRIPRHMVGGIELILTLRGQLHIEADGHSTMFAADEIMLINSGSVCSLTGGENNLTIRLQIAQDYLERECPAMTSQRYDCCSVGGEPGQERKFQELKRILLLMLLTKHRQESAGQTDMKALMFRLLHRIMVGFPSQHPVRMQGGENRDEVVEAALRYIHLHYREPIALSTLAANNYLSMQYLSKRFTKVMGVGFARYLSQLRLESARQELLEGRESITKIALGNGFPNEKAFRMAFLRAYNQSPSDARKAVPAPPITPGGEPIGGFEELLFHEHDAQHELVRYLTEHEIEPALELHTDERVHIDLPSVQTCALDLPQRMIKIGRMNHGLHAETERQLSDARALTGARYVHCRALFGDGMFQHAPDSVFRWYDYLRVIEMFKREQLTPIFELCLAEGESIKDAPAQLEAFLSAMRRHYSAREMSDWRFEIVAPSALDSEQAAALYEKMYHAVKWIAGAQAGFLALKGLGKRERQHFSELLTRAAAKGCPPDFLTVWADLNSELKQRGIAQESGSLERFGGFHQEMIREVKCELEACALPSTPIFITEWNTLAGETTLESGAFFRLALIMDAALSLTGQVAAMAYWVNTQNREQTLGESDLRCLGLYVYDLAKRPPMLAVEVLNRLGGELVYQAERVLITRRSGGDLVVLAYNPCYFYPLYAVDDRLIRKDTKGVEIELSGLESGTYTIKTFLLEKSGAQIFHQWTQYGFPEFNDPDVMENARRTAPVFEVTEQTVKDVLTLRTVLSYNAVTQYIIKKH